MLLDLWFHHANPPQYGGWIRYRPERINRTRENDEALLMLGLI